MSGMAPPQSESAPARGRPPSRIREAGRTRRLDASMTLLVEVMQHPLDPGYEAAARERARDREQGRRRLRPVSALLTLLVAVACGWVTTTAVMELRRPQPEAIRARAALENEIERRTAAVDRLQQANESLRASIAAAQQAALAQASGSEAAQARNLAVVTGEVPVTGPGLELTVDDAASVAGPPGGTDPRATANTDQGRVLDRDLQIIVNGLWAAGAEAISINGERLTALSAIRTAGQAILVDFRPLSPPYVIDAIGNAKSLQSGFGEGMAGEYLKSLSNNYGIRAGMAAKTSMTLPGAGSLALHYAGTPNGAPATASPTRAPTAPASPRSSTVPGTATQTRRSTTSTGAVSGAGTIASSRSAGGGALALGGSVPPSSASPGSGSATTSSEVSS
jgi:uncharacterized protein YlxW (UPF0749 family)